MAAPVAFISYCWTSPAHEQWVIELATELVRNGVDVRLDKWDLREGQDAHAYMESMVTDPKVTKVIVVSDQKYAEKADKRAGGVGAESQIMSAELYNNTDQTKFVAVIPEVDGNGEPYLPRFFTSRIYIPMTEALYATNFEQLLRWLYDKPLYTKPALGSMPEFLKEDRPLSPTRGKAKRAIESGAIAIDARSALTQSASLESYLESFVVIFEDFRADPKSSDFPQAVLDNIERFLPYRNEFVEVITAATSNRTPELAQSLQRFFERAIPFMFRPETVSSWSGWDFDNFKFIVHELFLYSVATLLKFERFDVLSELIELRFFARLDDYPSTQMLPYTVIWQPMESLRPKQQELRRASLRADLMEQRSHVSGVPFSLLMAADFVLFLRSVSFDVPNDHWYPETLLYTTFRFRPPFEIFARSESKAYFAKLAPVIGVDNREQLAELANSFTVNGETGRWLPRWSYRTLSISQLANIEKVGTRS
ncbi:toll/interleukin-1 receptor domain-containing protein [Bradyrhizobium sp. DASA03007]|uniref:toll/interleukin-1 receptor domain-containing protein n=1 Tax=unclassified Bradyrhizobium TaxID=2631580 RepID=UPI003F6F5B4E